MLETCRAAGGLAGLALGVCLTICPAPTYANPMAEGFRGLETTLEAIRLPATTGETTAAIDSLHGEVRTLPELGTGGHQVSRRCIRRMNESLQTCATSSPVYDPLGRVLFTGDLAEDLLHNSTKGNVHAQISKYRHYARMIAEGGLRPQRVFATTGDEDLALRWFTAKTEDGLPEVVLEISTQTGLMPPVFRQVLDDLGARYEEQPPADLDRMKVFECNCRKNPRASFRRAMRLSGKLMKKEGLDPDDAEYSLLRYTLARYLNNGTTPQMLSWLYSNWTGNAEQLLATRAVSHRWESKIRNMLATPATNREVIAHLHARAEQFRQSLPSIRALNPNGIPITFFAAGSLTKGRFSAASDLDIVIHTHDFELQERIVHGPHGFIGGDPESYSILDLGRWFFGDPQLLSNSIDEVERPGFLENAFVDIARKQWGVGLDLKTGALDLKGAPKHFVREESIQMDVVFEAARRYQGSGQGIEFVADYFEAVARLPEARIIPAPRLAALGERLLTDLVGRADQPETLPALIERFGVTDELERLMLDFAMRERALNRPEALAPSPP